jgi:hypothetical protein
MVQEGEARFCRPSRGLRRDRVFSIYLQSGRVGRAKDRGAFPFRKSRLSTGPPRGLCFPRIRRRAASDPAGGTR